MPSDITEGRGPAAWEHGAHQLYYKETDVPRLQAAVAKLAPVNQMVFLKWYLDDTSLHAMASILDVHPAQVTERVNEVRQQLWAALGKPPGLVEQEAKDRGEPCSNPHPAFIGKHPIKTETSTIASRTSLGELWQRRKNGGRGKKRGWETATKLVIIIPLVMYIIYDFVAYFMAGGKATLSTTTGNWLVKSFWIVLAVTLLVGHLFGSATEGAMTWRHLAVAVVGFVLGYLLTVM